MNICFRRDILKTKNVTLEFFVYEPTATYSEYNDTRTIYMNAFPVMRLKFNNTSKETFKITPRNLYKVVKYFNKIINWFYDKDKPDLFVVNDDNELVFNGDYRELSETITNESIKGSDSLKALPIIVHDNLSTNKSEGIILILNKQHNVVQISIDELELIFSELKSFSFTEEMNYTITLAGYLDDRNKITKYDINKEPEAVRWTK